MLQLVKSLVSGCSSVYPVMLGVTSTTWHKPARKWDIAYRFLTTYHWELPLRCILVVYGIYPRNIWIYTLPSVYLTLLLNIARWLMFCDDLHVTKTIFHSYTLNYQRVWTIFLRVWTIFLRQPQDEDPLWLRRDAQVRRQEGSSTEVGLRVQLVDANLDLQKDLMGLSGIYTHIYNI